MLDTSHNTVREHEALPAAYSDTQQREESKRKWLAYHTNTTRDRRDRSPFYAHAMKAPTHEHLRAIASTIKAKARAQQQESTPHERQLVNERYTTRTSEGENDADLEDGFTTCNDAPTSDINTYDSSSHI
jgi:hypothetical protein